MTFSQRYTLGFTPPHSIHNCTHHRRVRTQTDAVAQIKDVPFLRNLGTDHQRFTPGNVLTSQKGDRIKISLKCNVHINLVQPKLRLHANRVDARKSRGLDLMGSDTPRKHNDRQPRNPGLNTRNDPRDWIKHKFLQLVSDKITRPGIKDLHGLRACFCLRDQIFYGFHNQAINQRHKPRVPPEGSELRIHPVRASTRNHVTRHSPWPTTETNQSLVMSEATPRQPYSLTNLPDLVRTDQRPKRIQIIQAPHGSQNRALSLLKLQRKTHGVRDHQDIRKQYRSVKIVST